MGSVAAAQLKLRAETFMQEVNLLVPTLYTDRATSAEMEEVLKVFSNTLVLIMKEGEKVAQLADAVERFEPLAAVELPLYQWRYNHGECKATHVVFGNTDEDWRKYGAEFEKKHGEWPELVTGREALDRTLRCDFLYSLKNFSLPVDFAFTGTIEEYIRHAQKVNATLINTRVAA
jgi:hypothetical protein